MACDSTSVPFVEKCASLKNVMCFVEKKNAFLGRKKPYVQLNCWEQIVSYRWDASKYGNSGI